MNVAYEQVQIRKDTRYFLYVGEVKGVCLNEFLRETLSGVYHQEVDFISIVPDVLETYPDGNFLVINPISAESSLQSACRVSCRMPGRQFASIVSTHQRVVELTKDLVSKQGELLVSMFQTLPEMTLERFAGVRVIGPDSRIADFWNSKLNMYRSLCDQIPLPDFRTCSSREELLATTRELWDRWENGIFVSLEYSAAGAFSFLAHSEEEMLDRLGNWQPPYLVTRFIPHEFDPTVLAVVANPDEVYIGGIADQRMAGVNRFTGSLYPSILPEETQQQLKELTVRVGGEMGRTGYRGIFGCDYIVDRQGRLFFMEVNARKQGTTMEMCCTLENSLPPGSPSLMELEYLAVSEHRFPQNLQDLRGNPANIHWGTYNFKTAADIWTRKSLAPPESERMAFRSIAREPDACGHTLVVEHPGADFLVKAGTFLGRIIAVAKNRGEVLTGLEEGKRILDGTIDKDAINAA